MSAFLVCFFSPSSAVASGPNHFREEEKELQVPLVLFLNYFLTFVFLSAASSMGTVHTLLRENNAILYAT